MATEIGSVEIARILVEGGADLNLSTSENETPLAIAVGNGNREMVKYLLEAGAEVNTQDSLGDTPLHLATVEDYADLVEVLGNAVFNGARSLRITIQGGGPSSSGTYGSSGSTRLRWQCWRNMAKPANG